MLRTDCEGPQGPGPASVSRDAGHIRGLERPRRSSNSSPHQGRQFRLHRLLDGGRQGVSRLCERRTYHAEGRRRLPYSRMDRQVIGRPTNSFAGCLHSQRANWFRSEQNAPGPRTIKTSRRALTVNEPVFPVRLILAMRSSADWRIRTTTRWSGRNSLGGRREETAVPIRWEAGYSRLGSLRLV